MSEPYDFVLAMFLCARCGRPFCCGPSSVAWAVVDGERSVVCSTCAEATSPSADETNERTLETS
jgi:primosomal protein N'